MSDYRWGEVVGILKVNKFGFCFLLLVGVCPNSMVEANVGFSSPCEALGFCLRRIIDNTRHLLVKLLLHSGPSPENDDDNDDLNNGDDDVGNLCDLKCFKTWTATSQARCDFPVCSPKSSTSFEFSHHLCPSPYHDQPQAPPPPRCCCASS